MTQDDLARTILTKAGERDRFLVAIAGAPGSGKSTLSEKLLASLDPGNTGIATLVPMDGYHLDNSVIGPLGLLARKGAPETFNIAGLLSDLRRISARQGDVVVPLFDREIDLARANARIVAGSARIILVEGNYLLLDAPGWREIGDLFDFTIFLDVSETELEARLIRRWLDHGYEPEAARAKALGNDIPNARLVQRNSRIADLVVQ